MAEPSTILLAGGGTGGHLYPGIAVAEALRDGSRLKPVFLCTKRPIDRVILEPTGFEFIPQPIVPWKKSIGGTLRFAMALRETWDLVRKILKERQAGGRARTGRIRRGGGRQRGGGEEDPHRDSQPRCHSRRGQPVADETGRRGLLPVRANGRAR